MPRWNVLALSALSFIASVISMESGRSYGQDTQVDMSRSLIGRRPIPTTPQPPQQQLERSVLEPPASNGSALSGKRPRTTYSMPATIDGLNSLRTASTKSKWLPPLPDHLNPAPTINPSLPRYDTQVANNLRRKPVAEGDSNVVQSSFYAPQPPSMPTFPGGTFPPGSSAPPPTSSPGTFPPSGGLPTFGGSGSTFSDSAPSGAPGISSPPQPLIPGGSSSGGSIGSSGGAGTLPSAPPTSGIRSATPPAAAYPMPGIAGQGSVGSPGTVNPSAPRPLGSVPAGGGTMPGATPMTNMANPNNGLRGVAAPPSNTPRYATGEPFVTGPPPQVEMPYTHATVANNSCLPGWFQRSSTPVATTPTTAMNNTTSGVYPANTYPTNPATTNPNGYPGVPGYIVPPTVTQNMAPQMFSPNNNGYTPLVNWGTESSNVTIGRGMFGGPTVYVNNEPVRNFFRYVFH